MTSRESGRSRTAGLTTARVPDDARGAVLLLHGGRSQDTSPPSRWSLPALRMLPFGRAIARRATGHPLAIGMARYRHRGWNGDRADTAADARTALDALGRLVGPVPVVLVGHSLGGRAALRVADHPLVRAVVALAPWCPPDEPVAQLAGGRAVLLHCPADRVTDPRGSWEFVRRARAAGVAACGVEMPYGGHAMLRHAADWHDLTARLVAGLLGAGDLPPGIAAALAGGDGDGRVRHPDPPPDPRGRVPGDRPPG